MDVAKAAALAGLHAGRRLTKLRRDQRKTPGQLVPGSIGNLLTKDGSICLGYEIPKFAPWAAVTSYQPDVAGAKNIM